MDSHFCVGRCLERTKIHYLKDFFVASHHNSNTTVNENSNTIVGCLTYAEMEAWLYFL